MVDDPTATRRKPKRKGGRPSRAEASAKALLGVDLAAVDPVAILRAIAADLSAPASARVAACRALIAARASDGPDGSAVAGDAISVRAQQLLAARRKAN
jgi:hypothetical protein